MDIIKVEEFKKRFGEKLVHKGVTFSVKKGECLGLIGGSGAGKSVILRSLIGLESPDSGHVIIDGEDITQYDEEQLVPIRKKVAYVFQGGALFDSMSVFDNLAYPLREHTNLKEKVIAEKVVSLLDRFGLKGNEEVYPAALSGGMQKRVGLARAIIMEPDVILYDEPTAGLDPYNTRKIQELILTLKKTGVTSILVTHDMPSAFAVCDRIAMLANGKIGAIGTRHELDSSHGGIIHKFINGEKI
ncbi:MAG: ABC transporter ATP-binding protein [Bdellovibrionales bacterium]|nr:ABC transporter ATP-binding protein [Bdellovibrionales bacterium]